jgi:FKBP12-rapamycin complex-associated protein
MSLKNSTTIAIICEVLERLLTAGIADAEPTIRKTVLESLGMRSLCTWACLSLPFNFSFVFVCLAFVTDERFDPYLAQAENLHSLFVALNDEVFAIREAAITVIGLYFACPALSFSKLSFCIINQYIHRSSRCPQPRLRHARSA